MDRFAFEDPSGVPESRPRTSTSQGGPASESRPASAVSRQDACWGPGWFPELAFSFGPEDGVRSRCGGSAASSAKDVDSACVVEAAILRQHGFESEAASPSAASSTAADAGRI